jgi:hypothetical protein
MQVEELVAKLEDIPEGTEVYLSIDEEGNRFHKLYGVGYSKFYSDKYDSHPIHPDDEDSYDDNDITMAIVLWP